MAFPKKQGLYDPAFEKDSCGVGFVMNMKGEKSHEIICQGIEILNKFEHPWGKRQALSRIFLARAIRYQFWNSVF
jgi:glutamate synthase domain-containing protein 1